MNRIPSSTTWLYDIRFWILIFFVIRLVGITNPPLEVSHNWRQTTVTMVARNFLEVDNSIMFPRIDIAGEKTGITGMEFPLLNYSIYKTSQLFGYTHWYGRLINLIVSSIGIFYFHRLVSIHFDDRVALYASLVLLTSIWFSFSRKIMPDTFAVSLGIVGLYYSNSFLNSGNGRQTIFSLLASLILIPLACLSKLPAVVVLSPLPLLFLDGTISNSRKATLAIGILLTIYPVYMWYFSWAPKLVEDYGFWHFFMGKGLNEGSQEIIEHIGLTAKRFYDSAIKYSGFVTFLIGIYFLVTKRNRHLALVLLLGSLTFLVIVLKAGFTFAHHNYYIIPYVPFMALCAGYGLAMLKEQRFAAVIIVIVAIEGIANQYHDFIIAEERLAIMSLEGDLNSLGTRKDLILINSGNYPTPMYFAHRKGWVMNTEEICNRVVIDSLQAKGLRYIVALKKNLEPSSQVGGNLLLENSTYAIYGVSKNQ